MELPEAIAAARGPKRCASDLGEEQPSSSVEVSTSQSGNSSWGGAAASPWSSPGSAQPRKRQQHYGVASPPQPSGRCSFDVLPSSYYAGPQQHHQHPCQQQHHHHHLAPADSCSTATLRTWHAGAAQAEAASSRQPGGLTRVASAPELVKMGQAESQAPWQQQLAAAGGVATLHMSHQDHWLT